MVQWLLENFSCVRAGRDSLVDTVRDEVHSRVQCFVTLQNAVVEWEGLSEWFVSDHVQH